MKFTKANVDSARMIAIQREKRDLEQKANRLLKDAYKSVIIKEKSKSWKDYQKIHHRLSFINKEISNQFKNSQGVHSINR
jgi:hypothetical protein